MTTPDNSHLLPICEHLPQANIFVAGDVMIDRFVYGTASRISPEAPIPVLSIDREDCMLGGAGNVVRNIASLGVTCHTVALTGDDAIGQQVLSLLEQQPGLNISHITEQDRTTPLKIRYISHTQQLLRADHETTHIMKDASAKRYVKACYEHMDNCTAVILSDYRKGTLSPEIIRALIARANSLNIPVLIDPKQWDITLYENATLLSPNEKEMAQLARTSFHNDDDMIAAASAMCAQYNIKNILITLGARGMMLVNNDGLQLRTHAKAREVFDVSGAGDTVIATLACALGCNASLDDAAQLATIAAGVVVGRIGTATLTRTDLKTALHTGALTRGSSKIHSRDAAIARVQQWQNDGLTVGFTNGCFDLVHAGHVSSISACKAHCDRLVMAINSDDSIRRLKGPERPINSEMDRAMLLAALSDIDMVTIFREDTPVELLHALRPNVLMKGEDYQKHEIVGADFVESYGGSVARIPLVSGYSSTNVINKIRSNS